MDRRTLIKDTLEVLAKAGFYVSDPDLFRTVNFDIIARRDDQLLIIKALTNIDALKKDVAEQMMVVSKHLGAFPLLVGDRSNSELLEEGVVYLRHGIPVMSLETLTDHYIEGVPPFVFSAPGGPYVNIDGEELKRVRTAKGISLGTMAKAAGVSRRSIQLYESGGKAMFSVVIKIEEFLGRPIASPVEPYSLVKDIETGHFQISGGDGDFANHVYRTLKGLGFVVIPTMKCPFDALSEDKRTLILTGLGKKRRPTVEKARVMAAISSITEKDSVLILDKGTGRQNIEGTPVVSKDELGRIEEPEDLVTLLNERKKDRGKGEREV